MQVYKYKGYDQDGAKVEGEISAATIDEAERRILGQSVTIIAIVPASLRKGGSEDAASPASSFFKKKVSDVDAAAILRNLSVMAETGVPFIEALEAVIASARTPYIASAMETVKGEVVGGKSLSAAMRAVPWMFPPLVSDLIKVAEEGGHLDKALASGAMYLERAADLRKRIMQAMMYPIVMMSIALITVGVLVVYVMPKFADIFLKMNADVPMSTQVMLSVGGAVRNNPLSAAGALLGVIFGIRMVFKTPALKRVAMRVMMRVPILGDLLKKLALSRALQTISTLLNGNVPLMAALEHGGKVAGNEIVQAALMEARTLVEHGGSLSEGLGQSKVVPRMLLQMVAVGERTGRLAPLMATSAATMEEEADARLKAVVALVEPLMIVFMGLVVGTITVSIITPIYSVVQNLK